MFDVASPARARVESPQGAGVRAKELSAPARGGAELDGLAGRRGPRATGQEPLAGSPASGSGLPFQGRTGPSGPAGGAPDPDEAPASSVKRSRPSPRPARTAAASDGALDRGGTVFPPQGLGDDAEPWRRTARKARYQLRDTAAGLLSGEAVCRCGRYAVDHPNASRGALPGFVSVKVGQRGAHFGNVTTCKSVWHCPVCASKIAAGRREEVATAIAKHLADDEGRPVRRSVYMATLTIPHRFEQCRHLRRGAAAAYRRMAQGKHWKPAKIAAGLIGSIRALEITHGQNGWHPHYHVLLFFDHDDARRAEAFGAMLFKRWARAVERSLFGRCSPNAFRLEKCSTPAEAGDYVTKWGPDWELTHAHLKDAKSGGRTPWRILRDYAENGEVRDADLFREFALAFKGARQLEWSRGLKAHFGLADKDDAELADTEPPAETVAFVHEDAIATLSIRRQLAALLDAAETGGGEAVIALLYRLGVPQEHYRDVPRGGGRPPPDCESQRDREIE